MVPRDDEMCVDAGADKITAVNAVFSKEIAKGIRTLKAGAEWPKDVKTPAFRDEAANVYLNIVPKKIEKSRILSFGRSIDLPHPLSMNRSVCYVDHNLTTPEQVAEMTQKFLDHGVLGKIKIIPISLLANAFNHNNHSMLEELAEDYDDYFADRKSFKLAWKCLQLVLVAKNKFLVRLCTNGIQGALSRGVIWENSSKDGYFIKVGHAGLTNKQLRENIEAVVNEIDGDKKKNFPNGLSSVKSLQIKIGTSAGVTIYQDDTEVEEDLLEPVLPAQVIDDSIAALKETIDWPQEAKVPAFKDKDNTIYLYFCPKETWKNSSESSNPNIVILPHPLSADRSVMYVGEFENKALITQRLRDQGVLGKIKVVPKSVVQDALKLQDHKALALLADQYDTHLIQKNNRILYGDLQMSLGQRNKFLMKMDDNYVINLGATAVWNFSHINGFYVTVGHTGLTDQQLQENIDCAVNFVASPKIFLGGLADIKMIQLKTGPTKGVTIYQDGPADKVGHTGLTDKQFRENTEFVVKSLEIKTGTSAGVTIYQDDTEVDDLPEPVLPAQVIADGISALKETMDWPQEAKVPAFNDEENSIYLNFIPKKLRKMFKTIDSNVLSLPHPLSPDRSVIYISDYVDYDEQATITQRLRDQGILGKIKVVPKSEVRNALELGDFTMLAMLAENYDTHFVAGNNRSLRIDLREFLEKKNKFTIRMTEDYEINLGATALLTNSAKNGFLVKVGHTGLTDQELQENIGFTIDSIKSPKIFRDGLAEFKTIQLQTGTTEGVAIYQDSSIDEDPFNKFMPPEKIADGIAALKAVSDWPKEAKFDDKAANITVHIEPKSKILDKHFISKEIQLPHSLSLDRSVCVICTNDMYKYQQAQITQSYRNAGVVGKIKIVPQSLVDAAIAQNDVEAFSELADLYDTHVVHPIMAFKNNTISRLLAEKNKRLTYIWSPEKSLARSAIWPNSTRTAFFSVAGYTGLTDEQILENITKTICKIVAFCYYFPYYFASIKSIRLSTGTCDGIIIYQDDSAEGKVGIWCESKTGVKNGNPAPDSAPVAKNGKEGKKSSTAAVFEGNGVKRDTATSDSAPLAKKSKVVKRSTAPIDSAPIDSAPLAKKGIVVKRSTAPIDSAPLAKKSKVVKRSTAPIDSAPLAKKSKVVKRSTAPIDSAPLAKKSKVVKRSTAPIDSATIDSAPLAKKGKVVKRSTAPIDSATIDSAPLAKKGKVVKRSTAPIDSATIDSAPLAKKSIVVKRSTAPIDSAPLAKKGIVVKKSTAPIDSAPLAKKSKGVKKSTPGSDSAPLVKKGKTN